MNANFLFVLGRVCKRPGQEVPTAFADGQAATISFGVPVGILRGRFVVEIEELTTHAAAQRQGRNRIVFQIHISEQTDAEVIVVLCPITACHRVSWVVEPFGRCTGPATELVVNRDDGSHPERTQDFAFFLRQVLPGVTTHLTGRVCVGQLDVFTKPQVFDDVEFRIGPKVIPRKIVVVQNTVLVLLAQAEEIPAAFSTPRKAQRLAQNGSRPRNGIIPVRTGFIGPNNLINGSGVGIDVVFGALSRQINRTDHPIPGSYHQIIRQNRLGTCTILSIGNPRKIIGKPQGSLAVANRIPGPVGLFLRIQNGL